MVVLIRFDVVNHEHVESQCILRWIEVRYRSKFLRTAFYAARKVVSPGVGRHSLVRHRTKPSRSLTGKSAAELISILCHDEILRHPFVP